MSALRRTLKNTLPEPVVGVLREGRDALDRARLARCSLSSLAS